MNKKFLSAILFGALMASSTGTFVSCKDYDDDIDDLWGAIDKKASLEELTQKLAAMESSVGAAKNTAEAAKTTAEEALAKAEEALANSGSTGGTGDVTQADLANLKKEIEAQISKLASLDAVNQKIEALKEELKGDFMTEDDLKGLNSKVDALSAEIVKLIGHRLTSLSVIPTQHINGIAAITFTTLQYTPQKYQAMPDHTPDPSQHATHPVLDHVNAGSVRYISTEKNEALFHVSPNLGVRTQDINLPSFDCIQSENVIRSAAITNNSPIEVVGHAIDNKGVLTVTFKKNSAFLGKRITTTKVGNKETFYMASLKAPITEENWTEAETADKAAGKIDGVYVNSEYARIEESIKYPYLANSKTDFNRPMNDVFADETQIGADGSSFYVHYHDSICMYKSNSSNLVDVYQAYDQPLDLKKLVTVCVSDINNNHDNHEKLANYKDYGLEFRFRLAKSAYYPKGGAEGNDNKTDQQQFATIDTPANGIMSSKVYSINGGSATAVGREPIVCVELIDTKNGNALIAQRYLKVKWTMEGKTLEANFDPTLYSCGIDNVIGTEEMNVWIYDKVKTGGMTKNEFHSIYTQFVDPAPNEGTGTAVEKKNSEAGVDSYNIVWTLTDLQIGTIWPGQEKTFTKTVYYKDPTGINADVKIVMKRTIYMPVLNLWGYMGPYWKGDKVYEVFNINPIVFNTQESNPAWANNTVNNPTCNIYTDLLNGFLDDRGIKPTTGAGGAIYYTDKNKTGKKFYYSAFYPRTGGTSLGTAGITYEDDGVSFVFDKNRIANYTYTWKDGSKVKADVRANGTELWIKNELAATIVNNVPNKLDPSEITYNIKLEEAVPTHAPRSGAEPTDAARALVGELVPINLVADLCDNTLNVATVKQYEAFIIDPLNIKEGTTENFVDAKIDGSSIDVTDAFTYYSWNDNNQVVANTTGLPKQLYEFYEVDPAKWPLDPNNTNILDVTKIKTNLKLTNGSLEPDANETNGTLPANVQIKYEWKVINGVNREVLTYYNYSGTPVNKEYKLYIPVEFGYKWKTRVKVFTVIVKPNSGTPGN